MKQFSFNLAMALLISEILLVSSSMISGENNTKVFCYHAEDKCPNKDISFWLYTREIQNNPVLLDIRKPSAELFADPYPLKILIHGLTLNHDQSPNEELRPWLLEESNNYVISMDYSSLSHGVCLYPWAIQNARVVAKCLGLLLNNFIEMEIFTPEDIHIIGFSLGGQVAGLTANHLNFKVKRITGLDPAGFSFSRSNATERLDSSDAQFVDVIHTDPRFFSTNLAMGHADFYPNYMRLVQPGCSPVEELRNCNHFRSNIYYAESMITTVGFWSFNCGSYLEFKYNRCENYSHLPHVQMGYFVDETARGSYFLDTNSQSPFAQGELVQVELEVVDQIDIEK